MSREEIIRMAREAGGGMTWWPLDNNILERFAERVASAEREACAALVMGMHSAGWDGFTIAEKIRARGEQE